LKEISIVPPVCERTHSTNSHSTNKMKKRKEKKCTYRSKRLDGLPAVPLHG
jgi:hypothetical protein